MQLKNKIFTAMIVQEFIDNLKNAFGDIELPIAFWYSTTPKVVPIPVPGCYLKSLKKAREGVAVSFDSDTIKCSGGKVYAGYIEIPEFLPNFVANKEHYKESPEMVVDFIDKIGLLNMQGQYLNFARIDQLDSFDHIEGLLFFATPDILSGLVAWTQYDTNDVNAVSVPFGSGCSSTIACVLTENRKGGKRTFLGMFDPSARPTIEENMLSFSIPMSRFSEMYYTINKCCLNDTHGWSKIKNRINHVV